MGIYHFFEIDGAVEVVPAVIKMDNTDLREVADSVEQHIADTKAAILDPENGFTEESHIFYGYYINYGDNLSWDAMEGEIIEALMKVNNDLEDIKPEVVTCDSEKVLTALRNEKFSISDTLSLSTNMQETK